MIALVIGKIGGSRKNTYADMAECNFTLLPVERATPLIRWPARETPSKRRSTDRWAPVWVTRPHRRKGEKKKIMVRYNTTPRANHQPFKALELELGRVKGSRRVHARAARARVGRHTRAAYMDELAIWIDRSPFETVAPSLNLDQTVES